MSLTVTIGVIVLIVLMVTGIPVAFAFLGAASIMAIVGGYSTGFMVPYGFAKINSIILLAMPMFILAGSIMEFGGIGEKLVNAGNKIFGRIKGGLGILVIVACGIFGAISGSSTAATLLCTPILVPVMVGLGFDPVHFAAIFAVNIGFANVTPPCAPLLYLSGKVMDVDVKELLRPNMWYLLAGWLPVLLVTTYWEDFSLFLPRLILGYGA